MPQLAVSKERAALLEWLSDQRQHVLRVLSGLPDEAVRRPVLPSGRTCLGLVRHLAVDVERFWFRGVIAAEPIDLDDPTGWETSAGPADAVFELYREEIAAADAILATADLDAPPVRWPQALLRLAAQRRAGGHLARDQRDRGARRPPRRGP
jgi:Protein of unknown function (DUF664)